MNLTEILTTTRQPPSFVTIVKCGENMCCTSEHSHIELKDKSIVKIAINKNVLKISITVLNMNEKGKQVPKKRVYIELTSR